MAHIKYLQIKNWEEFQHYKDRNPPWIKLSTQLFQDYEFACLQDASKLLAICSWTLASKYKDPKQGLIPYDFDYIKRQGNLGNSVKPEHLQELIDTGFLIDASKMLASCYQSASPETETETYIKEKDKTNVLSKKKVSLDELSVEHVTEWLEAKRQQGKYLAIDENHVLEVFKNYCKSKGKRYVDYIAAYRNAFGWDRFEPKNNKPTAQRAREAAIRGLMS